MEESLPYRPASVIAALTEEAATAGGYPAGGTTAGMVAALAASLAAAAADRSRQEWPESAGARAQAQALGRRATELAQRDAAEYAVAREALAQRSIESQPGEHPPPDDARDWSLGRAISRAAGPPLELAATAADIAQLAGEIAARGAGDIRGDAAIAAVLAAAASRAGAALVQLNLVVGGEEEPAVLAGRYAEAAAAAAAAAMESGT